MLYIKRMIRKLKSIADFVKLYKESFFGLHPVQIVFIGYGLYICFGWILLSLPFAQTVDSISSIDNLFIATSAVSTTGLVTVSISDSYSLFGEIVVLLLIQLGGVGYMTIGSFVILSRKTEMSDLRKGISKTVFALPKSFKISKFIRSVMSFTLSCELIGAIFLYFIFLKSGTEDAFWNAIFHSVSAFCTAGFSLFNTSFEAYYNNFWLNIVIAVLSYLGAIGFIVHVDIWRKITHRTKNITFTSKIILYVTFWVTVFGTLLVFISEPEVKSLPVDQRLLTSFFQAMTSMTTVGFNTINIGGLTKGCSFLLILLMIIGASPSGTGGGIKSTTLSAIYGLIKSTLSGKDKVYFWNKLVPEERVQGAVANVVFYALMLIMGIYFLLLSESASFLDIFFEATSAIGTVGLSRGITTELTNFGKVIIILLMYAGRLGPLSFGSALFISGFRFFREREGDSDIAV